MSEDDALVILKDLTAWQAEPALPELSLRLCLRDCLRYLPYPGAGATVTRGQLVVSPLVTRQFACSQPGVTAGTLADPASFPTRFYPGLVIPDGTAVWVDCAPTFDSAYDLKAAARLAWLKKAGLASELHDFKGGEQDVKSSQLFTHCTDMASRFTSTFLF